MTRRRLANPPKLLKVDVVAGTMANERHGRRKRKLRVVATPSAQLVNVEQLIEHTGVYLREMLDEGLLFIENGVIRARQ